MEYIALVKVLISVDDKLLRQVDRMAAKNGLSRSAYFAQLAERDAAAVSRRERAEVRRALERLDELFAEVPPGDSTAEIRAERDAR